MHYHSLTVHRAPKVRYMNRDMTLCGVRVEWLRLFYPLTLVREAKRRGERQVCVHTHKKKKNKPQFKYKKKN